MAEGEAADDARVIEARAGRWIGQHGAQLAGGEEQAVPQRPVQGLDAELVAGGHEITRLPVGAHECEHPPEGRERSLTVGDEALQDDLGVGVGAKPHAPALEPRAQLAEVEDLPVEDEPPAPGRVGEGLIGFGVVRIDDRQPHVLEDDLVLVDRADAFSVRSAMAHRGTRPRPGTTAAIEVGGEA